jgi:nucleoside-diphosphate-sugar epimerase
MGLSVAITGSAGLIGRSLATRLAARAGVDRVLGLDLVEAGLEGVEEQQVDIADPGLSVHLEGCDVLVHLAFIMNPMVDETARRAVNVEGTQKVFEAAVSAGVGKIVYASSASAYGAHSDNDMPLREDSPLRANPDFSCGEHKLAVEQWLWPWLEGHPDLCVVVFRPAIVAGPGVDNFLTRLLEMPKLITVRGYEPPFQFVHVDDVAAGFEHAVVSDELRGAYNLASEGWLSFDEAVEIVGKTPLELPEEVAFGVAERLWRLGVAEVPHGYLHYMMHPWVLSVDRLRATGWEPTRTNREALVELVADHATHVALRRGVRLRKRNLRLGAGIAGAALAALAVRRILDDRDPH